MALHPFLDSLDVVIAVLQVVAKFNAVARHGLLDVALPVCLIEGLGPAAVLDTRGQVTGKGVLVGGWQVQIPGAGRGVAREERVHIGDLSGVRVHAASGLARLDVTPDHGNHVALIVHEAGVEVGGVVRVGRGDVGGSTREGILEEVEHGEELARGPVV